MLNFYSENLEMLEMIWDGPTIHSLPGALRKYDSPCLGEERLSSCIDSILRDWSSSA